MQLPGLSQWKKVRRWYAYRTEPESMHALARLYWDTTLIVAAIVIILSVLWGAWSLASVIASMQDQSEVVSGAGAANINRAQLDSVLEAFKVRAQQYKSFKSGAQKVSDPSL